MRLSFILLIVAAVSVMACAAGTGEQLTVDETLGADANRPGPSPEVGDGGQAACTRPEVLGAFAAPVTVAGTGKIGRRAENGWRSEYEGGPATAAELSRPHFAMADRAGNIYVADKDAHAIRRLAPDGTIHTVAGTNQGGDDGDEPGPGTERRLSRPNGLWVRADGTVYILDLGNSKIRRLDGTGELTTLFAVPDGISIGRGLWVGDDERLAYVASGGRALRWTPDDGVVTLASGFRSLGNLVVDPSGRLVVTDRAAGRVYRIDAEGNRTPIAGSGGGDGGGDCSAAVETALPGVRGLWFHPAGGFFLATHESSRVWYVDGSGLIHRMLDEPTVSEVRGISLDHVGNLIVVDDDRGFVRILRAR